MSLVNKGGIRMSEERPALSHTWILSMRMPPYLKPPAHFQMTMYTSSSRALPRLRTSRCPFDITEVISIGSSSRPRWNCLIVDELLGSIRRNSVEGERSCPR